MERVSSPPPEVVRQAQQTHEGMTGKNNEDDYFFAVYRTSAAEEAPLLYLGLVADGVGGQSAGEFASHLAGEMIASYFDTLPEISHADILDHIARAIKGANQAVFEKSETDAELQGMATTLVLVAILDGLLFISHVGDSRAYLWRQGTLHQLTKDHTWVQEAVDAGLLTADQGFNHPNRNIIRRSLGSLEHVDVDQRVLLSRDLIAWQGMPLQKGDTLLLCSDGLTDMLPDAEMVPILNRHGEELEEAASELIDRANEAGGRDNITVMLLHLGPAFVENGNSPFPQPDPPLLSESSSLESDTVRNIPKVISVPLNKKERAARARQRRLRLITLLIALVLLMILIALFATGTISLPV